MYFLQDLYSVLNDCIVLTTYFPLSVTCQPINNINPMWSGNGPIKTIDSPGYAEALRMAQAEDETLGIRNIYGTRSSKEITVVESLFANFFFGFCKGSKL